MIISVDKSGHVNQCLAVAERLCWAIDEIVRIPAPGKNTPFIERRKLTLMQAVAGWRARPRTRAPGHVRIIASGAAAETVVARYRALNQNSLYAIFSGRPEWDDPIFDLALAPSHALTLKERTHGLVLRAARQTILRRGVPVRAVKTFASERRGTFAMIGGVNKTYTIDPHALAQQIKTMVEADNDNPFTVTFSRRTPVDCETHLRAALGSKGVRFIDRSDRTGFEHALSHAANYVVTPDSITMLCEACDTGRPVRIFDLPCSDPESTNAACVRDLLKGGEIALAPNGMPQPQQPGRFVVSASIVTLYNDWCRINFPTPLTDSVQ